MKRSPIKRGPKRKAPKSRKPTKRSQAKRSSRCKYADRMWSRYINARDGFCQMASDECSGRLEAAHIIGKQTGKHVIRWELDNGVLLCALHHRRFDGVFDKWSWAEKRLGTDRWEALQAKSRERWDRDYDRVYDELKTALKEHAA